MGVINQSKADFVAKTMAKYGFGNGQPVVRDVPHKNDYAKPDIPIEVITHDRFKEQGRQHVIASIKVKA